MPTILDDLETGVQTSSFCIVGTEESFRFSVLFMLCVVKLQCIMALVTQGCGNLEPRVIVLTTEASIIACPV